MGAALQDYEIPGFTGVNLRDQPLHLGPADLIGCQNMYPVVGGGLVGRGGQADYFSNAIGAEPVKSLYRFYKQNGTKINLLTAGTKVYTFTEAGASEIDSGYTSGQRFDFVSWSVKDKVFWLNNAQALRSYDGTSGAPITAAPLGSQLELHDDRLWILQPNGVRFSALNDETSWPAANLLNLADSHGGAGSWIKSFTRGLLIIAKDSGLYRFEGSPNLGARFTRFSDVRAVAPWTADIVLSQEGAAEAIAFLAADGVYATDGFNCVLVSPKLDPLFSGQFRTAVGKYHPKRRQYLLSYDSANAQNDTLWAGTYLATDRGPMVGWTEYSGFNADSFVTWDGAGDSGEILYGRSNTGKVARMDLSAATDFGSAYKCSFQTRWEDQGDKRRAKSVRWLFPVFEASNRVNYQIAYSFGPAAVTGPIEQRQLAGISWGPGSVNWGPGVVVWHSGGAVQSSPSSTLNFGSGRYFSFYFENTGDGPGFKFHNLSAQIKWKDKHYREPFSIAS